MSKIKAILFDMDGVLIDAKEWHYEALNKALDLFGIPISRREHESIYDGLPTRRKLAMLSESVGLPVRLHDFINELKQAYTMDMVHALCRPRFAQEYALSQLKRMGYKLAVCSNSVRATVALMMERAALAPYLDLQLSNQDVARSKPAPDIYLAAMERLDVRPDECLVVEDNENGIQAAKAAGAHLLVVSSVEETNFENIINRVRCIELEDA